MLHGADVSHHNGPTNVPWSAFRFGCVRITWGVEGVDPKAAAHIARARAAGVDLLLAFHYLKDDSDAHEQAEHFLRRKSELEALFGPLGCALDLEDLPGVAPWNPVSYGARAGIFTEAVTSRQPRPCTIYSFPYYFAKLRKHLAPIVYAQPLWLSDVEAPITMPHGWDRWTILQHTYGSKMPDGVDRNRFDGSEDDFRRIFFPDLSTMSDVGREQLGGVVMAVHRALGTGDHPEHFLSEDEGPVIEHDTDPDATPQTPRNDV